MATKLWNSEAEKLEYNKLHFDEAAPMYDVATRGLSLFQDASWKDRLISLLPDIESANCLDLACGTGDITINLRSRFTSGQIVGVDISPVMLTGARERTKNVAIDFIEADICDLPFEGESFDIVTGGYALRNAPSLTRVLREIERVLTPGGQAVFLEFAKSDRTWLGKLQARILGVWGAFWGLVLHRNAKVHGYLKPSFEEFPSSSELEERIARAGLVLLKRIRLFPGMTELIVLKKDN